MNRFNLSTWTMAVDTKHKVVYTRKHAYIHIRWISPQNSNSKNKIILKLFVYWEKCQKFSQTVNLSWIFFLKVSRHIDWSKWRWHLYKRNMAEDGKDVQLEVQIHPALETKVGFVVFWTIKTCGITINNSFLLLWHFIILYFMCFLIM